MREHVFAVLALLTSVSSLRICTRRHFQIVDSHFFQRVHLPLPELCVERCIEHLVYCKAAQFTSFQNRTNGVCELHSINSGTRPGSLHPDANLDPLITVYEIMESCPTFVASDMASKISEKMQEVLEKDNVHEIEERKADASFQDMDQRVFGEDSIQYSRSQGYALMRTLEDDPKNPFEPEEDRYTGRPSIPMPVSSTSSYSSPSSSSSSSNALLPPPISPALVLHQGRCTGPNCPSDASMPVQSRDLGNTYITRNEEHQTDRSDSYVMPHHDKSPCPARQGDPCAPKPACAPHCHQPLRYDAGRWTEWSPCSATCGDGMRTRQCLGDGCSGPATLPCRLPCPQWSPWAPWSICSTSCGEGERRRSRICVGGRCDGPSQEMERCASAPCPEWTEWGQWEGCSVSCGTGREKRLRRCENGLSCRGSPFEDRVCTLPQCPYLGPWTEWTPCTVSCGVGEMTRSRKCIGEGPCERGGPTEERLLCNQQRCPEWTTWTAWTACNSCEKEANRIRNRMCLYESRPHNSCVGPAQDQSPCPQSECAHWTEWGDWSDCSQPCGQGQQKRRRECKLGEVSSPQCKGPGEELRFCQVAVCPYWREWSEWSGCSVTCGRGVCTRSRKCVTDELLDIPNLAELEAAVNQDEELARINDKNGWRRASAKAQLIARSKRILHGDRGKSYPEGLFPDSRPSSDKRPALDEAAAMCDGPAMESKNCDPGPCCGWREWSEWERCDGCLAGALQRRSRQCSAISTDNPVLVSHSVDQYQTSRLSPSSSSIPSSPLNVHPIFRVSHPQNHPNIITAGGPYDIHGLTPIIAVNDPRFVHDNHHIAKRHSYAREECHCDGPREETRPCSFQCQRREECKWTEWSDWCGCIPCRPGRESRRRLCERADGRSEGCQCEGGDTEERPCPTCSPQSSHSSSKLDRYVPISTGVIVSAPIQSRPQQESRHSSQESSAYAQSPMAQRQIQVESSTVRDDPADYAERQDESMFRGRSREYPEYAVSRRDTSFTPSTTPSLTECHWSRWSGWSNCLANRLRQRSRFCIGAGAPVSSCECSGLSVEETGCEPERRENSEVEFTVRDTVREGSGEIQEGERCEWTPWSQWSDCSVSCGSGEKIRRKRCPCGPNHCGGGVTLESDLCEKPDCESFDFPRRTMKKLPVFSSSSN